MKINNKISIRLIKYFVSSLILFALVTGGVYVWNIGQYSTQLHRQDMEERAIRIADTMAGYLDSDNTENTTVNDLHGNGKGINSQNGNSGYGRYLSLLEDIAMSDVWLIDDNGNLITKGEKELPITEQELPDDANEIIQKSLAGEIVFSERFSSLLGETNLSVSVPIKNLEGKVLGVVLLHSPIHGLAEARNRQIQAILISVIVALIITIPLIVLFSLQFTKPLNKMKNVSGQLAEGDYRVKTDISQNDEIGELANSIDILSNQLAESSRKQQEYEQMRQMFFSNISHELRTPVTVMRGSLEALRDGIITEPEKINSYYNQMLNESIHLQRLVNDLLELSRLQNIEFDIEKVELNFSDIIHDIVRTMKPLAEKKNIDIQLKNIADITPFYGDYSRLRQMLIISLDNAIKFSPPNSIVLIQQFNRNSKTVFSIKDSGIGISPENLPHIFERFYRDESEWNTQGTGLGLPISKAIAIRHSITIEVESEPNNTVFYFVLP